LPLTFVWGKKKEKYIFRERRPEGGEGMRGASLDVV